MKHSLKRAILLIGSLIITFAVLRVSLIISPNSNFDVGSYNIHHLYTGLIILTLAVMPLLLFEAKGGFMDLLVIIFGVGLSMALDEWVYLIATDGSDAAYLQPVSLWGGIIVISLTCLYIAVLTVVCLRGKRWE